MFEGLGYSRAMPRRRYIFDPPERFVAGTVGEPGERTFFLQARDGGRVVSVVLEKVQVAVLADRLNRLLDQYRDIEQWLRQSGQLPLEDDEG